MASATSCARRRGPSSVADRRCPSPMAADRRTDGRTAEAAARTLLLKAGLTDIAANAAYRGGEIDLVMRDGTGTVVFVEVRFRRSRAFGGGAASVDAGKRRR